LDLILDLFLIRINNKVIPRDNADMSNEKARTHLARLKLMEFSKFTVSKVLGVSIRVVSNKTKYKIFTSLYRVGVYYTW
jgi:hypothetical protein